MPIPTDVRNAVVGAYYPRALAVADSARSRAQAAYGIASAIAAALVAAGVFGNLDQQPSSVQILGILSLVCWLLAAGLFMVAVSVPFEVISATQPTVNAFVHAALDGASTERAKVDRWQGFARIAALFAAALTVAAFCVAILYQPSSDRHATVTLTTQGAAAIGSACGKDVSPVTGRLAPGDLQNDFVDITLDKGICHQNPVSISVPRAQVRAVVFTP